jgi:hypothetical protein
MQVNLDRLEIRTLKPNDDVSKLDCTEDDGSDPLGVQNYLRTKAVAYNDGRVSAIFIVKQDKRVLAFFTLSMTSLESNSLAENDKLADYSPISYLQFFWVRWEWIKVAGDRG